MTLGEATGGPGGADSWKILRKDMLTIGLVAIVSALSGFAINQFRGTPLPFAYQPRAERIAQAATRLGAPAPTETPTGDVEHIRLDRMASLVQEGGVLILDARASVFYKQGHIPGALNVSREEFEADYSRHREALEKDKTRPIALYCADESCHDSELVAQTLIRMGYQKVLLFRGGWYEWTHAGMAEEK